MTILQDVSRIVDSSRKARLATRVSSWDLCSCAWRNLLNGIREYREQSAARLIHEHRDLLQYDQGAACDGRTS